MNRIALATAGLLITGGFAVAVPVVAGGSATADSGTVCESDNVMNHDYKAVQRDKATVKVDKAKVNKIKREKPKSAKAKKARTRHLTAANKALRKAETRLRHDQGVYNRDVPCDPDYNPTPSASPSVSPSASASTSPSTSASPSSSVSASPSSGTSSTPSGPLSPICSVIGVPIPVLC